MHDSFNSSSLFLSKCQVLTIAYKLLGSPLPLWPHLLILLPSFTLSSHVASSFLDPLPEMLFLKHPCVQPPCLLLALALILSFSGSLLWHCFPLAVVSVLRSALHLPLYMALNHFWANFLIYLLSSFIVELYTLVLLTDVPNCLESCLVLHIAFQRIAWLNEFECGVWHTWVFSYYLTWHGDFFGLFLAFIITPSQC